MGKLEKRTTEVMAKAMVEAKLEVKVTKLEKLNHEAPQLKTQPFLRLIPDPSWAITVQS